MANLVSGGVPLTTTGGSHPWRRWAFHLTILVVLATAFLTSWKSSSAGAGILGFPPKFLFAAPLICDVLAGLATLVHGWARDDPEMRRLAMWFVMVPMALSWAANAVDHVRRVSEQNPGLSDTPTALYAGALAGVILFAGLCPVAVAALLHFSTKFGEFEARQAAIRETASETVVEPEPWVEDEPEFVEPPARTGRAAAVETAPLDEPEFVEPPTAQIPAPQPAEIRLHVVAEDPGTKDPDFEAKVAEVIERQRLRGRNHVVSREAAEVMVCTGKSRATAHRILRERREASRAALA